MRDDAPAKRPPQVAVIGNAEADPPALQAAELVGRMLGRLGCTVISGGGEGIMRAVSQGAKQTGALTVGVLPGNDPNQGNHFLDVVIASGIGYARNMINVLSADLVIAIGGSAGTLSEIAYAWMHNRPIVAFVGLGGWADRLAGDRVDSRREDRIERAETLEALERIVRKRLSHILQS